MNSLENKNLALEKELLSAKTDFSNTLQKLKEAEKRCSELQTNVQRFVGAVQVFFSTQPQVCVWQVYLLLPCSLEEKLSRLENENHVLRQNTLSLSPKRIGQRLGEVCNLWLFSAALSEYACTKVCTLWNCWISYLFEPCIPPPLLVNYCHPVFFGL